MVWRKRRAETGAVALFGKPARPGLSLPGPTFQTRPAGYGRAMIHFCPHLVPHRKNATPSAFPTEMSKEKFPADRFHGNSNQTLTKEHNQSRSLTFPNTKTKSETNSFTRGRKTNSLVKKL